MRLEFILKLKIFTLFVCSKDEKVFEFFWGLELDTNFSLLKKALLEFVCIFLSHHLTLALFIRSQCAFVVLAVLRVQLSQHGRHVQKHFGKRPRDVLFQTFLQRSMKLLMPA